MTKKPSKASKIRLSDLVESYIVDRNAERPVNSPLAARSVEHLRECARLFSRFLGCPATVADFKPENVNTFLRNMLVNKKSEFTVKARRTGLLVLWRYAARRNLIGMPDKIQKVRLSPLSIKGYDQAAIVKLIEYVSTLRGVVRGTGLRRQDWWTTFILVCWETGIRSGDMLRIRLADLDKDGWIWICESKTGKKGWRPLRPSVVALLKPFLDWDYEREFIWPGYVRRGLQRTFSEIARKAGVGGSLRWIRRGSASEVEAANPGAAWRFLKHSTPTLYDKHYRVDKIVEKRPLLPPEINADTFAPDLEAGTSISANLPSVEKPAPKFVVKCELPAGMTLLEFVQGPIREARPDLPRHYQLQVIRTVERLRDSVGRDVFVSEVTPRLIDDFAASMETRTARQRCSQLLRSVMRTIDPCAYPVQRRGDQDAA